MAGGILDGLIGGATGGVAVAGAWIYSFLDDRIISRNAYKEALAEKDRQIAEWKETAKLAEQRAETERRRAESATDASHTANILLAALQRGTGSDAH